MVEQTDAEFIARIKALAEKATKEPWDHVICDDNWQFVSCSGDIVCHQDPNHSKLGEGARSIDEMDQCNFAFIAAARTAIPRLIGMVEEREREQTRLRKFLSDGEYETVQSEKGWKHRALAAEQNCESYKYACKRAGICMTCVLKAPEPYGCTDCLNTGFTGGDPIAERDAAIAAKDAAGVEIERLSGVIERDRTKTAESIARLRTIVAGRSWLGEGRGNLAWDDDQYQEEFRCMIEEFMAALDPLKVLASGWSDCPKDFQVARIDWKVRAEAAESAQREAVAREKAAKQSLATVLLAVGKPVKISRHILERLPEIIIRKDDDIEGPIYSAALASKE